ncbi:hypothetical protein TNCV_2082021 [Trichonephila clavipes]|nr:hypothetical protein TNCV_2082021 [Trichonephila clavipes]
MELGEDRISSSINHMKNLILLTSSKYNELNEQVARHHLINGSEVSDHWCRGADEAQIPHGLQKTTTPQGGRPKRSPLELGRGEWDQHPCPPENRRAFRKGPVQHKFDVDVSGDCRVQWLDETRQLLCVLATWKDP